MRRIKSRYSGSSYDRYDDYDNRGKAYSSSDRCDSKRTSSSKKKSSSTKPKKRGLFARLFGRKKKK